MRCRSCGYEMPEGSRFCENCGAKVEPEITEFKGAEAAPATEQPAVTVASGPEQPAEKPKAAPEKKIEYKLPDNKEKRSLKLPLFIAAAVVVIAALILIIKPWNGSASQTAKAYKAFSGILTEKADDLAAYDWQLNLAGLENGTESRPVLFRDICGNEIPELILVRAADKEKRTAMLEIYTFEKGAAKLIFSQEWNFGLKYILYQNKDDKTLKLFTNEGYGGYLFEYFISLEDDKGSLTARESAGRSTEKPESALVDKFRVDGKEVTKEEYAEAMAEALEGVDEVLMYSDGAVSYVVDQIYEKGCPAQTVRDAKLRAAAEMGDLYEASEKAPAEIVPGDMPDSLNRFLLYFSSWYDGGSGNKEYECTKAAEDSGNILAEIVGNGSIVDFNLYLNAGHMSIWDNKTQDPRGWNQKDGYMGFAVNREEGVDWIARNIFNVSDADIRTLKKSGEEKELFYIDKDTEGNSNYYNIIGGVGDPFISVSIGSVLYDGSKYYVSYDLLRIEYGRYGNQSYTYDSTYSAVMEYKTIDGRCYWSMYSNTPAENAEDPSVWGTAGDIEDGAKVPDLFAKVPKEYIFTSGVGGWGTVITINEDGSFSGSYEDHNYGESGDGYDGTQYVCEFTGKFTDPVQINAFTYAFKLTDLQYTTGPAGESRIVNDPSGYRMRVVSSEAYGISGGDVFYLFAKGAPVSRLPKQFMDWMYMPLISKRSDIYLSGFGLYNLEQQCGFYGAN
ncbi:MAG: zinc ribbon domain-containing protein [Firmicutes bacterium]|nr:zinc ribbon domain-containing protein [Bacillota bacterium]